MRHYADLPNLHARLYAMRSRLFSRRDYAMMIREQDAMPGDVSTIRDLPTAKETLFAFEIAPVITLAQAYEKYTPFFIAQLRQYETANARVLLARAARRPVSSVWYDIGPFARLKKDLLGKDLSLSEVQSLLADIYSDKSFLTRPSFRQSMIRLDVLTARLLYHSADSLVGSDMQAFRTLMRKRIAVTTIVWSNRLGAYYRLPNERIRAFLNDVYDLYGKKTWYRVGLEEDALGKHLDELRKNTGREPSIPDIEHELETRFYTWIASMFHRDFHAIYCVVCYLWLLFYQIRNLFRILDGKRFGLSPDAILDQLVCEA
jgi:vacuolar-type H+-ATPase subunit C/Vma6